MATKDKAGAAGQAAGVPAQTSLQLHVHSVFIREHDDDNIGVGFAGADGRGLQLDMTPAVAMQVAEALRSGRAETMPDGRPGRICVVPYTTDGQANTGRLALLIVAAHADRVARSLERGAARLTAAAEANT